MDTKTKKAEFFVFFFLRWLSSNQKSFATEKKSWMEDLKSQDEDEAEAEVEKRKLNKIGNK